MPNQLKITPHYDRAVEVARGMVGRLEKGVYPFNIEDLRPDTIVPENMKPGSAEHALFLFFACGWDSMEISERVYERARTLASNVKLVDLITMTKSGISHILKETLGPGFEKAISSPVNTMYSNAKSLLQYQGDPRRLKAATIRETVNNLIKFTQYGPEKAALLIKNFVRFGIWDFSEFEIPIKIDRHALKIGIGAGVITFPEETEEIRYDAPIKTLKEVYSQVTRQEKISAIKLDDATWGTGSKLCGINKRSYCDNNCPIGCEVRPYLDSKTTIFHIRKDTREQTRGLFF